MSTTAADITASELAKYIDHTLLAVDATPEQVYALAAEAQELGTFSICVSPSMLPVEIDLGDVKLATVCGFPSGKHDPAVKAAEAALACQNGADEVDMVIDIGLAKAADFDALAHEIGAVRDAMSERALLKVIIESAALTDDEIIIACRAAVAGGAQFVKTSTGFHPAGGASTHAVALMREIVGPEIGVKASGGIRDYPTAIAMIEAGASRLGCSASAAILAAAPR
ncbi:MAG: deoxyribose-phosphate aldolase [Propionibacteriaceae bacterium]|jgi:deoxyribose-phosphate aldolase|nr:deoxyribose-phosphate aldolase [Propionibacteriaceae bacterium]